MSVPINTLVNAGKRSLLCYRSTTYSSTAVKLVGGTGPVLEVKRNGVPLKQWHASLVNWIDSFPRDSYNMQSNASLKVHLPPPPKRNGGPQMR